MADDHVSNSVAIFNRNKYLVNEFIELMMQKCKGQNNLTQCQLFEMYRNLETSDPDPTLLQRWPYPRFDSRDIMGKLVTHIVGETTLLRDPWFEEEDDEEGEGHYVHRWVCMFHQFGYYIKDHPHLVPQDHYHRVLKHFTDSRYLTDWMVYTALYVLSLPYGIGRVENGRYSAPTQPTQSIQELIN